MSTTLSVHEIPPRREHKYVVPVEVADEFRDILRRHAVLDDFAATQPGGTYDLTSLYYDTADLELFALGAHRVRKRFRLRVRSYGDDVRAPTFFEVKHRIGDIIMKRRAFVEPTQWPGIIAGDVEPRDDLARDFVARVQGLQARPTLLVRYRREPWKTLIDRYVRVTFDSRLAFALVDPDDPPTLRPVDAEWQAADDEDSFGDDGPLVLIEVKVEEGAPRWLSSAIRDLGMQRRGYSKFATGIARCFGPRLDDVMRRVPVR
ncbi:MAG TPA: polyphosphate polymerase domain-containing protein [Myxococcota bacterium]